MSVVLTYECVLCYVFSVNVPTTNLLIQSRCSLKFKPQMRHIALMTGPYKPHIRCLSCLDRVSKVFRQIGRGYKVHIMAHIICMKEKQYVCGLQEHSRKNIVILQVSLEPDESFGNNIQSYGPHLSNIQGESYFPPISLQ